MRRGGRLPQSAGGKIPVLVIINTMLENTRTFGSKLKAVFSNAVWMDPHSFFYLGSGSGYAAIIQTRIQILEPTVQCTNYLEFFFNPQL